MSGMKDLLADIMDLWETGMPISEIAALLRVDRDIVEKAVEQYSSFYD